MYGQRFTQHKDTYKIDWPIVQISGTNFDGTHKMHGGCGNQHGRRGCKAICMSLVGATHTNGFTIPCVGNPGDYQCPNGWTTQCYPAGSEAVTTTCVYKNGARGNGPEKNDWVKYGSCSNPMAFCECQGRLPVSLDIAFTTTTSTTSTTTSTTTTTTTTTRSPYKDKIYWTKGKENDNCMVVCGGKDKCIESTWSGVWPTSSDAFEEVLEKVGQKSCTLGGTGDWQVNPGLYTGFDNQCYWKVDKPNDGRCAASHWAVARFCPCKEPRAPKAVPTTTKAPVTTTQTPTTPQPSPGRRRGQRKSRRRRRSGKIQGAARRRRRRRRHRRRKQS